ncbi:MAG: conjugal transfer protein TraR [Epsilonproteobacteria bacterium]|nr:MAG: conjugal transfer protein TraR [Campylobacterota bacterium]RLA65961.1 MAG: conjugal transfer protein TraR [Campylobacterota bacterium]
MKKIDPKKQRELLLNLRSEILNSGILKSKEDLTVTSDDLADEGDLASVVVNQEVSFEIRNREFEKLRAVENALAKIENGTYGLCEECDEKIKIKRLEKQPWATLCITHAEEKEREQQKFSRSA